MNVNNNNVNDIRFAQDVARNAAKKALAERGIENPESLIAQSDPTSVLGWCRWWDRQRSAGTGLLVSKIRSGQEPPRLTSTRGPGREYMDGVVAWLRRGFPDLINEKGYPHPAAFVEVTRLHSRLGKGTLTFAEHGSLIREAVARWERKWGEAEEAESA